MESLKPYAEIRDIEREKKRVQEELSKEKDYYNGQIENYNKIVSDKKQEITIEDSQNDVAKTVIKPNEEIKPTVEKVSSEVATPDDNSTDEKPKKTRRPNRGTSKVKKTRTTRKTKEVKSEE